MRHLLSVGFILLVMCCYAQKKQYFSVGYIIRPDSTLKAGYVQELDSLPSNACYFKDSANTPVQKFTPDQILGYGFFRGKNFISYRTQDRVYLFFEKLNDGEIKFYKALSLFLVQLGKERPKQLLRPTYKAVLSSIMEGCPYVTRKIEKLKLERKALLNMLKEYNNCLKSDPNDFNGTGWVKLEAGIFAGFNPTGVKFEQSKTYTQLSGQSVSNLIPLTGGVQIWLSYPYYSKRLSLRAGANYSPQRFGLTRNTSTAPLYEAKFSYTEIQVPIALQCFLDKKKQIFVKSGVALSFLSNLASSSTTDTRVGSSVYIDDAVPVTSIGKNPQFLLGVGGFIPVFNKHRIIVEATYTTGSGYFSTEGTSGSITTTFTGFSLTSAYIFK